MALNPIKINPCIWKDYLSSQESKLPRLEKVTDVTPNIARIMGGNPGAMQLQGTNTYLVGSGKSRILIDTGQGFSTWTESIISVLEERDIDLSHVLLTHWHGDHTGGVPDLIAYNSDFADRVYKNNPDPGQRPIEHGQIFRTDGATIRAVFSPGHAIDHMCFAFEEENALFTGDNVLGHGYSVVEDLKTYMTSLETMENQRCAIGYPAHGDRIENLPLKMKQYIHHRKVRERQVYSALVDMKAQTVKLGHAGRGSLTPRELVHNLHGEVPPDVVEMALEPFTVEVLWKLAEDRKVGFELDRGNRRWFLNERSWAQESGKRR